MSAVIVQLAPRRERRYARIGTGQHVELDGGPVVRSHATWRTVVTLLACLGLSLLLGGVGWMLGRLG